MNPERLSDRQLFALKQNPKLNAVIKAAVELEFQRRSFSEAQLQKLLLESDLEQGIRSGQPLSVVQWLLVVLFPFPLLVPYPFLSAIPVMQGTVHLWKGNQRRWRQHWRLMMYSLVLWMLVKLVDAWIYFAGSA